MNIEKLCNLPAGTNGSSLHFLFILSRAVSPFIAILILSSSSLLYSFILTIPKKKVQTKNLAEGGFLMHTEQSHSVFV